MADGQHVFSGNTRKRLLKEALRVEKVKPSKVVALAWALIDRRSGEVAALLHHARSEARTECKAMYGGKRSVVRVALVQVRKTAKKKTAKKKAAR